MRPFWIRCRLCLYSSTLIPAGDFSAWAAPPAVIATVTYAMVPVIRPHKFGYPADRQGGRRGGGGFRLHRMAALVKVQETPGSSHHHGRRQPDPDYGHVHGGDLLYDRCAGSGQRGCSLAVNRIEIGRGLLAGSAVVVDGNPSGQLTQGRFSEQKKRRHARESDSDG